MYYNIRQANKDKNIKIRNKHGLIENSYFDENL